MGRTPLIPKVVRVGPSPRTSTVWFSVPAITKPPIVALSPASTSARVEILARPVAEDDESTGWFAGAVNCASFDTWLSSPVAVTVLATK